MAVHRATINPTGEKKTCLSVFFYVVVVVRSDNNVGELLQCARDVAKVHRVVLTLVCQQASCLLKGSGGQHSSP